jgi:hypothetical protein
MAEEPFDTETKAVIARALDEAWRDLRAMLIVDPLDEDELREKLEMRISAAARIGERDPKRLKLIGLGVF